MKRSTTTIAAALLVLLALSCDESSPTAPAAPQSASASSSVTVELCSGASSCSALRGSLQLGLSMPIYVVVTYTGDSAPTQAGINTTLGNFGQNSDGSPVTEQTLTLTGSGSPVTASVTFSAGDAAGTASIAANVGSETDVASVVLTEEPALFLQSVSPSAGPVSGGNQVSITGQGFDEGSRVAFGGVQAEPPSDVTASSLIVTVPPPETPPATGSTLVVDVTVTNPPESTSTSPVSDTLPKAYTYTQGGTGIGPSILSVSPRQGENSGDTEVTITGDNFPGFADTVVAFGNGDTPETFSGIEADLISVSATQIVVTTPPAGTTLRNQTVDILVRDESIGLATLAFNAFTYGTQDVVLDIQPRELSYRGSDTCNVDTGSGDCVTISAQGLPADTPMVAVEFGGVSQGTCSSTSTDTCAVTSSSGTTTLRVKARSVSVQDCSPPSGGVTLIDQQTGESSSGPIFSYTATRPIVTGVDSGSDGGAQSGGKTVTVQGTFDTGETGTVLFGGVQATVLVTTESAITVRTPPFTGTFNQVACGTNGTQQVPTAVDVEVLYPGSGCSAVATGAFTYTPDNAACVESSTVPVAVFSWTGDDDTLTVTFTDESANDPTSWSWDFGDGSTDSNEQHPVYTYSEAGTYTVTLQATNAAGTDSTQESVTIGSGPVADFSFIIGGGGISPPPDCADLALYVRFFDESTGDPTSWEWEFGDGGISTVQNPDHCYAGAGTGTVTLTVTNGGGSDTASQSITVPAP